jgi:hypothetical protein
MYDQPPTFPPPPGSVPSQYATQPQYAAPGQYGPPPAGYNSNSIPPPPGPVQPGPPQNYGEAFASGANMDPYAPRRGAEENVSAAPSNGINSFPDQRNSNGMWR